MGIGSVNAPRKSTYQSAKAAGYKGTEEEFWADLNNSVSNGGGGSGEGGGSSGGTIDVAVQTTTLTTGWTVQDDGTYAQTVNVEGVTGAADQAIWVDCHLTREDIDADIAILEAWGCINNVEPAEGSLTFYCYGDVPTVAIPVNVVVI